MTMLVRLLVRMSPPLVYYLLQYLRRDSNTVAEDQIASQVANAGEAERPDETEESS